MSSSKQNLRLIGAFAVVGVLALVASCRGFFVNPTITSLAIGPANLSLAPSTTFQMVATATFSDGSTGDVTGKSVWTSSNTSVASFSSPGRITAGSLQNITTLPGTTSVSASDGTVSSSSQTVTVCPVVQTLVITVNSGNSATVTSGQSATFAANATFNSVTGTQNVTANVTWTITPTTILPSISSTGVGTTTSGQTGNVSVSASICGVNSNTVTLTVD